MLAGVDNILHLCKGCSLHVQKLDYWKKFTDLLLKRQLVLCGCIVDSSQFLPAPTVPCPYRSLPLLPLPFPAPTSPRPYLSLPLPFPAPTFSHPYFPTLTVPSPRCLVRTSTRHPGNGRGGRDWLESSCVASCKWLFINICYMHV